jgi:hypothetical protein
LTHSSSSSGFGIEAPRRRKLKPYTISSQAVGDDHAWAWKAIHGFCRDHQCGLSVLEVAGAPN